MRKICLLGGTGFVGKPLAKRLFKEGWQVNILTQRREQRRELRVLPNVHLIATDVNDQTQLNAQLAGCDVVINLVGIRNEKGNDGSGFRKAHVELSQKLITACQTNHIKHVLHLSALNADAKNGKSHYFRTKGEAEDLLHAAEGVDVTSFKPSIIFGDNDRFFKNFASLLRVPSPIFMLPSGYTKFSPVWLNDVVEAMLSTIGKTKHYGQRYNLCGPTTYTLEELVAYTAKMMGVQRHIIPLNDKYSRWVALFMNKLPSTPYSIDNYQSAQMDSVCDDNHLPQLLSNTPHTIESIMPKYFSTTSTPRELYSQFRMLAGRT